VARVGNSLAAAREHPNPRTGLLLDPDARRFAVFRIHEHYVRCLYEAFLLDNAALPRAAPAGSQVALLHSNALDADPSCRQVDRDDLALFAAIGTSDDLDQITRSNIEHLEFAFVSESFLCGF
jgi:hypothetical protein